MTFDEVEQLKAAIDANDLGGVQTLMLGNPQLHSAPLGYGKNGPLTWAAECRGHAPTPERLSIAHWMIENGSDIHQGGDGPLMRAALNDDRIPMIELLLAHGANVNALWNGHYPIIFAPCETLQPRVLELLLAQGAHLITTGEERNCVAMVVGTYARNPVGKRDCLQVFEAAGYKFPDTAAMAAHRGRVDLLEACLRRDPTILTQRYSVSQIFPAEIGLAPEDGLHCAPLAGATLLHLAVEYHELEVACWLMDHGADVNARTAIDAEGFGGQTPLFHTTVTLGLKESDLARLLLQNGANPSARATFRKQLRWNGDADKEAMREFHDVTAIGFAQQFQEQGWVNEAAIKVIRAFGGE